MRTKGTCRQMTASAPMKITILLIIIFESNEI